MDYNKHKGGVDTLDKNCEEFNCLRNKNRWPMVINYNLINVATNNTFIVMRRKEQQKGRVFEAAEFLTCTTIYKKVEIDWPDKAFC